MLLTWSFTLSFATHHLLCILLRTLSGISGKVKKWESARCSARLGLGFRRPLLALVVWLELAANNRVRLINRICFDPRLDVPQGPTKMVSSEESEVHESG